MATSLRCLSSRATRLICANSRRNITLSACRQEMFSIQDEKDFKEKVIASDRPVVVNFKASWCGPCKMLTPRLEKIMDTRMDTMHFARVDIDDNVEIAMEYSIDAVPAIVTFKGGKVVDKVIGLKDDDQLISMVDKLNN
ncbi:thioredoxin, mitochondrial [Galendromus occidentalis]|uniref:Thioredoxin, mitochondrial n=1 Tax=Galendromus occidentalis TaxID=34638 RepID=A0AAJ7L2J8_9ACAR|nr:thioredoxin, mitochondrial [Galendromus occidentalis]